MATDPAAPSLSPTLDPPGSRRGASWLAAFLILLSSFLAMIAVAGYSSYNLQNYWATALRQEITRNLVQKAQMFASRVETDHSTPVADIASQEGQHAGARATVVDASGRVIADSEAPAASLDNEGRLPEFAAALRGETGTETRVRNDISVLYVAVPVSGGAVRLACPMADYEIAVQRSERLLLLGCIVAACAGLAVSALGARLLASL